MIKPGGSEGGVGKFMLGLLLSAVALYFFFDSVRMSTRGAGLISGGLRGRGGGGGLGETTSMGIIFLPFIVGLIALFYNAKQKWAWAVTWIGVAVLAIEILSRIRPHLEIKTSHLMIMMVTFSAGVGLILQSYRDEKRSEKQRIKDERDLGLGQGPGSEGAVTESAEEDKTPK
jgi:hypothetical protein